jgi:hypothetical protein
MRLSVLLISLLCGCSTPTVRCDTHLKAINPPAAGAAAAAGSRVTEPSGSAVSAGETAPSRREP